MTTRRLPDRKAAPEVVRRNVDGVLRLEEHASRHRSAADSAAHTVGRFVGTLAFVGLHAAAIAAWVVINAGWVRGLRPFDPYPFNLLSTVASCEAVFLAACVLITQNRMQRLADRRDHLDLQVNLMTEQEVSLVIQILARISDRLGVQHDDQEKALELSRTATLDHLAEQLRNSYPDDEDENPRKT